MTTTTKILQIDGPYSVDRRDSAIMKRDNGILHVIENMLIEEGNLNTRLGNARNHNDTYKRYSGDSNTSGLPLRDVADSGIATDDPRETAGGGDGPFRVLALHRFYGISAETDSDIAELYAVVDGSTRSVIKKWNGSTWDQLKLPLGVDLSADTQGNFEQFKDRTYYTNQSEPVLMIRKEDSTNQVYEAGVPDPDREKMLIDCETITGWTEEGYTFSSPIFEAEFDRRNAYLDDGFERHTEGDYGITIEVSDSGKGVQLTYDMGAATDLTVFTSSLTGTVKDDNIAGIKLVADTSSDNFFSPSLIGQQIINITDRAEVGQQDLTIERKTSVVLELASTYYTNDTVITTPLDGGHDDTYTQGDQFLIGSLSSLNDYIGIDIFRFTKNEIEACWIEFSSELPAGGAQFNKGFRCVIYADSADSRFGTTPTDFDSWTLHQRTMLAKWAMDPYSNRLFLGRFRKKWFIPISSTVADSWRTIRYFRIVLMHDSGSTSLLPAKVTIDNIRLLKTPPLAGTKRIQVATCDPIEPWTYVGGGNVPSDVIHATEGVGCKVIAAGATAQVQIGPSKDLKYYSDGIKVEGSDEFVFDLAGTGSTYTAAISNRITLIDNSGNAVWADTNLLTNILSPQQRKIHIQEFEEDSDNNTGGFDWERVEYLRVANGTAVQTGHSLYIDNIRIQSPSASKMINKFIPVDLIAWDLLNRGVDHYFGENPLVDFMLDVSNFFFYWYAKFTRQASGNGAMVFPEYQHGRYKLGNYALPSLQLQVDAGGAYSVTFTQDNDFSEYDQYALHLDGFWSTKSDDATRISSNQWFGVDWIEIPATPEDEFSIWLSTPNVKNISKITFRFYANADANWVADTSGTTHTGFWGMENSPVLVSSDTSDSFRQFVGCRIVNESWTEGVHTGNKWGIIGWGRGHRLRAWGVTWRVNDTFTIDRMEQSDRSFGSSNPWGFAYGKAGQAERKPVPDADNYWEYTLDFETMFSSTEGLVKGYKKAAEYHVENEESLVAFRDLAKEYGIQTSYYEREGSYRQQEIKSTGLLGQEVSRTYDVYAAEQGEEGWWSAVMAWKIKDMIPHLDGSAPSASMQSIAAHQIVVQASSKESCIVNFQDFMLTKKGAVKGDSIRYKLKIEDEQGFVGPASEASHPVSSSGSDVQLSDLYIPYELHAKRKRLYRTDSTGQFRYLDTIDRLESSYLDQIPEELLGELLEEDFYPPPQAKHMRKVNNRMAYVDCVDRRGYRRSSRFHLSAPFAPHQCRDADAVDILPEDGQSAQWMEWYYGYYIAWKERSYYTVDPDTLEYSPRDLSVGLWAPLSLSPIPGMGFGWMSHEGPVFGDHTTVDKVTGQAIWPDLKDYSLGTLRNAVGFYHKDYYYLFVGAQNEKGYALYIPRKQWTQITDWSVHCITKQSGQDDNNLVLAGSNYGYVNTLFSGSEDSNDTYPSTASAISYEFRTLDHDFGTPHTDKYFKYFTIHAKKLETADATIYIVPYVDQVALSALTSLPVTGTTYRKLSRRKDQGDFGTHMGARVYGTGRAAIKGIILEVGDVGFRYTSS